MKPRTLSSARSAASRIDTKSLLEKKTRQKIHNENSQDIEPNQSAHSLKTGQEEKLLADFGDRREAQEEMEVSIKRSGAESSEPERKTFSVSDIYTQLEDLCSVLNKKNVDEIRTALLSDPFLVAAFYRALHETNML